MNNIISVLLKIIKKHWQRISTEKVTHLIELKFQTHFDEEFDCFAMQLNANSTTTKVFAVTIDTKLGLDSLIRMQKIKRIFDE